jgi:hypothetical protein
MSNKFHKSMADKFNKKKTINNDISRISNIHKKINTFIPILNNSTNIDIIEPIKSTESLYHFDKLKTSTTLNLDTSRENYIDKIPKISFKQIIVPSYFPNDNFDLNKINQTISTPIHMDIFISHTINEGDVNRLKKKHVKKIYHIYQEKYANNSNPTGFGDFIRSCFFIIQFSIKYNFDYEILINHPIAEFLQNYASKYFNSKILNKLLNNTVHIFNVTNWTESIFDKQNNIEQFILSKQKYNLFIDYLCSLPINNNSIFSYNIFFPIDNISLEEIDKIKFIFEPSREIIQYVDETLLSLNLVKNNFFILHIRSGDSYLKGENKIFHSLYFEIIKNEIIEVIFNNKDKHVLLIADNNEIKYLLRDEFPYFKLYFKDITHLGEGMELEREKVKNTLLDFYLMSYATHIYSFTSYPHGSGFSYWCSKLYNIPYNCKYINVK